MLEIRSVSPHLGAEVTGVDVRNLDDDAFNKIYQAFLDHIVVVIRDQHDLSIEEYLVHSDRFGTVKPHIVARQRHPKYPNLMLLDSQVGDQNTKVQTIPTERLHKRGTGWHTDLSYDQVPAKATQLYTVIRPPSGGGDTLFASAYRAYDALPERLKTRIENLEGMHIYGGTRKGSADLLEQNDRNRKPAIHRAVKIHPETGRRSLYIDPRKFIGFVGMETEEANTMLAELTEYMVKPGEAYRHTWLPGDIVIWDNRCAWHAATGDYPPEERRLLWRVTIMEYDWQEQQMSA
jgi:taurine dioxygenase